MKKDEDLLSCDIDILVEFGAEKSLLDLAGLKIELEESLGRKVDVYLENVQLFFYKAGTNEDLYGETLLLMRI